MSVPDWSEKKVRIATLFLPLGQVDLSQLTAWQQVLSGHQTERVLRGELEAIAVVAQHARHGRLFDFDQLFWREHARVLVEEARIDSLSLIYPTSCTS
jgi:hypothetical protein